ncbi:kin of IRRE-like protein 1 [Anneissia japonica]|uniref:kin of IRRE-like protein 1 n=1 Tax=Anneissia japonica TaxID=1529436 RepID=UPI00142592C7|nr:kin of IRRE-like protein 1 [Anneissia japonica]XP_033115057.1 kin of IRRE-like protein 1 [Anneissia japonica]
MKTGKMFNKIANKLFVTKLKIFLIILVSYLICVSSGQEPTIQTKPQALTVATEGQSLTLYCNIQNLGTYNVSWMCNETRLSKNKQVLVESSHYDILEEDNGGFHLRIKDIKRSDKDCNYKCAIYNNDIFVKSHQFPAKIKVSEIPQTKYPICDPLENGYNENTTIEVRCRGERVNPRVIITWMKNGKNVKSESSVKNGEEIVTYSFKAQQSDSSASLKCTMHVVPTGKTLHCTPGQLNIRYKPNITIHEPESVSAGKEAVYICRATANPKITGYKWNVPANLKNKDYKSDRGILRITPTLKDNLTKISCTASNQIGNVTRTITLRLLKSNVTMKVPVVNPSVTHRNNDNSTISLFAIVLVAVGCSSLILLLMVIPVCYYYTCQRHEEGLYMPRMPPIMVQPDVYSEPKDMAFSDPNQNRTLPLLPSGTMHGKWKRSVGVQVPTEIEIEEMYAHVEGEAAAMKLNASRVRSTKSEYV